MSRRPELLDQALRRQADDRAWGEMLGPLKAGAELARIPGLPLVALVIGPDAWGPSLSPQRLGLLVRRGILIKLAAGRYRLAETTKEK